MDIVIGGGIAATVMYAASKWKSDDSRKMLKVFNNIGYKVGDHKVKLKRKDVQESHTDYIFSVPYGLVDDPKLQPILEKTLCKPIQVMFKGKLIVRVYGNELPKLIKYDWPKTEGRKIPIGLSQNGTVYHDFDKIPHMTIAGTTRFGKTVLLKLIMAHLINNQGENIRFHIIDLKGGLEFWEYKGLKAVKTVASDVYEANKMLRVILKGMKDQMAYFKKHGIKNILHTDIKTRDIIIIDEGGELVPPSFMDKEEKAVYNYCQYAMSQICRIGGSLGFFQIFCTQYPTFETLPKHVKQNSDAKITFRLPTEVASRVAIDESGAEKIGNVGRAIYKTHEQQLIQVPLIEDSEIREVLKGEFENDLETDTVKNEPRRTNNVVFG